MSPFEKEKRARARARHINSETYKAEQKKKQREKSKRWHKKNPERAKQHARKRRAKLRGVKNESYTDQQILNTTNGICYLCNKVIKTTNRNEWHIDHVYPLSGKGHDVLANLAPTHAHCNQAKHARQPTRSEIRTLETLRETTIQPVDLFDTAMILVNAEGGESLA